MLLHRTDGLNKKNRLERRIGLRLLMGNALKTFVGSENFGACDSEKFNRKQELRLFHFWRVSLAEYLQRFEDLL